MFFLRGNILQTKNVATAKKVTLSKTNNDAGPKVLFLNGPKREKGVRPSAQMLILQKQMFPPLLTFRLQNNILVVPTKHGGHPLDNDRFEEKKRHSW